MKENVFFTAKSISQNCEVTIAVNDLDAFFHASPDDDDLCVIIDGNLAFLKKKDISELKLYKDEA